MIDAEVTHQRCIKPTTTKDALSMHNTRTHRAAASQAEDESLQAAVVGHQPSLALTRSLSSAARRRQSATPLVGSTGLSSC